jgi:HlyD family secretion protein
MKTKYLILSLGIVLFSACSNKNDLADAYGNFESTDQLVTAEIPGKLLYFTVEEGQILNEGDTVALIDTVQLFLKKEQLKSSIRAIRGKLQDPGPQTDLLEKQIQVLDKERKRVESLLAADAATQKQLDDIQGKIDILSQQIVTTQEQVAQANDALLSQIPPLKVQIEQLDDQLDRCFVTNPRKGTVLLKLAEPGELVNPARPLYKIADISTMELRAYVSGAQLPQLKIGKSVDVEIDLDKHTNQRLSGEISWIADRAEFTPKTIQTKEERVNLVYAFKVRVDNREGLLKIGMPGEVRFPNAETTNP